jgi:hypothetical protein
VVLAEAAIMAFRLQTVLPVRAVGREASLGVGVEPAGVTQAHHQPERLVAAGGLAREVAVAVWIPIRLDPVRMVATGACRVAAVAEAVPAPARVPAIAAELAELAVAERSAFTPGEPSPTSPRISRLERNRALLR